MYQWVSLFRPKGQRYFSQGYRADGDCARTIIATEVKKFRTNGQLLNSARADNHPTIYAAIQPFFLISLHPFVPLSLSYALSLFRPKGQYRFSQRPRADGKVNQISCYLGY